MTDFSERNDDNNRDDKLERMLRLYGTAVRDEADERFTLHRDRMISRAVRARRFHWFVRLVRGLGEILDPRFAGGMAVGVTAAIALLIDYQPNHPTVDVRASRAVEAGAVESGESSRAGKVSRGPTIASAALNRSSASDSADLANGAKFDRQPSDLQSSDRVEGDQLGPDDFYAGEMAMNDLMGAFTPPEESGLEVAAIWPESDDTFLDSSRGVTQPQSIDGKTKQEEDEIEEFYLNDDQTA
jgi:hypothetical protein